VAVGLLLLLVQPFLTDELRVPGFFSAWVEKKLHPRCIPNRTGMNRTISGPAHLGLW
jgi:hypothetical protein